MEQARAWGTRKRGTIILKDGRAWGIVYRDGQSLSYGWVDPCKATVYGVTMRNPEGATYPDSPLLPALEGAEVVQIELETIVREVL